ncbi:transmembrane protein, putative (macronuclear) [Tetrahymena thermophila SB210]|uniref:Transmembrane protein, putative n=1 Tax=Tetrahymena thermophila (strain SB210) TaxID=312017 RepID=Q23DU2_TETTS|nr:transmembrane protein, putative [Tetrahymena thermophila SB210]EAR94715.1 transmembrane protein, putative [Tetrahymena thermophila SB210]|eukprot:XP_001014594.1 transmembrane protein, putative [Tetrahymena thermophila SB210]
MNLDLESNNMKNDIDNQPVENAEDVLSSKPPSNGSNPQMDSDIIKGKEQKKKLTKLEKMKRKQEKQKIVTTAKIIIFSELLISTLVVLQMCLFYAKIYISKQEASIAYIVLYIFSDVLFISSWITSFAALILRNNICLNYCNFSLGFNIIFKIAALIVYQVSCSQYTEIPSSNLIISLTVIMIFLSAFFIYLYSFMKNKWNFIPADRWQRKFNPNLRYEDIKKTNSNATQQSISNSVNTNPQQINPQASINQ